MPMASLENESLKFKRMAPITTEMFKNRMMFCNKIFSISRNFWEKWKCANLSKLPSSDVQSIQMILKFVYVFYFYGSCVFLFTLSLYNFTSKFEQANLFGSSAGWVDDAGLMQEGGVWTNNFSQHAFTTGRRHASKSSRFKGNSHTMKVTYMNTPQCFV